MWTRIPSSSSRSLHPQTYQVSSLPRHGTIHSHSSYWLYTDRERFTSSVIQISRRPKSSSPNRWRRWTSERFQSLPLSPSSRPRDPLRRSRVRCSTLNSSFSGLDSEPRSCHFNVKNPGTLSWFVAGYSPTVGSFILLFGHFGDYFGHKRFFITGLCWFSLWSMVAGVSDYSNYIFFIFALAYSRVSCRLHSTASVSHGSILGIGPAMCLPNAVALLGATYPRGLRKHIVFGVFGAVAQEGAVIGAIFGSVFQDNWSWANYSLALVLATAAIISHFVTPDRLCKTVDRNRLSVWQRLEN